VDIRLEGLSRAAFAIIGNDGATNFGIDGLEFPEIPK